MKPIAPGTVIFHRHRGYGVLTAVNLLTGWVSARFGSEQRSLDLNLSSDELAHADGEAIRFRLAPPERMPHARLIAMVRALHLAGYQRLYLASWPKPSGLHWHWHLLCGPRNWLQAAWRPGWFGSGANYNMNPVLGWGDAPGATTAELIQALAQFDPQGLAQALGRDEDHTNWFAAIHEALSPDFAYSFASGLPTQSASATARHLAVMSVRADQRSYQGKPLDFPPGWPISTALNASYPLERVRFDILPPARHCS